VPHRSNSPRSAPAHTRHSLHSARLCLALAQGKEGWLGTGRGRGTPVLNGSGWGRWDPVGWICVGLDGGLGWLGVEWHSTPRV
jgi:hypothetical protein